MTCNYVKDMFDLQCICNVMLLILLTLVLSLFQGWENATDKWSCNVFVVRIKDQVTQKRLFYLIKVFIKTLSS